MWASVTPKLEVQFAFFNNLRPMPVDVTHRVDEEGVLGDEVERTMEQSIIIREVDATRAILSLGVRLVDGTTATRQLSTY
jgi:hypothetical protein